MQEESNSYFFVPEPDLATYDVYDLFQFYNTFFFHGLLERCTVRWTKKMTLCAGTCKNEGQGSSTISLSEPLLKFRTSNELKETLIHEMIHAYLFITNERQAVKDGGHGPAFQALMHKINSITGLKISIYHNFNDQVDYYRQHIWRCNGRCRQKAPHYGFVKRSMNRKPQPADYWWGEHLRTCGGQFIKISEPLKEKSKQKNQNMGKKKNIRKLKRIDEQSRDHKSWGCGKTIQQYLQEMKSKGQSKRKSSIEENKGTISMQQYFTGKAKTIQQYSFDLQDEKITKQKGDKE